MNQDWKENPKLRNMDKSKLEMLQNLADQGSQKSPTELLPFLMAAASKGKSGGLNFNDNEISMIIEVLKAGKSPAETAKLDKMIQMMRMLH